VIVPTGDEWEQSASSRLLLEDVMKKHHHQFLKATHKRKWILVVLNPSAGQSGVDLRLVNRIIHNAGMDWEMGITNTFGDGGRLAARAVAEGASLVAACGGDGTISDVATGLLGSDVPLAILPNGTGNVLAKDLGIPLDLSGACNLMVSPQAPRRLVDIGSENERLFLLRLGVGLEAEIVRTADRGFKDMLGPLAYIAAAIQAWSQAPVSRYHLELDGQVHEIDGLACMVANAGSLGIPGLSLSPTVKIDDGLLDVFVIRRADMAELSALATILMSSTAQVSGLPHWQARDVSIEADPPQGVEVDGDEIGGTPVRARLIPSVLKVIVPPKG
jgi:diacylglycerol kinase (ATP)